MTTGWTRWYQIQLPSIPISPTIFYESTRYIHHCPTKIGHMLIIQPALLLIAQNLPHKRAGTSPPGNYRLRLLQQRKIKTALLCTDILCPNLPLRKHCGHILQQRKLIHRRRRSRFQNRRKLILSMIQRLDLRRLKGTRSTLPKYRGERERCGIPADMVVIVLRAVEQLVHGPGGFCVLDWECVAHEFAV